MSGTTISYFIYLILALLLYTSEAIAEDNSSSEITPVQTVPVTDYGPVKKNEGLWIIASQLRGNKPVSNEQMAMALYQLNPDAFRQENINALLVGAVLKVPGLERIKQISKQDALELFQQHWQDWQSIASQRTNKPITKSKNKQQNLDSSISNTLASKAAKPNQQYVTTSNQSQRPAGQAIKEVKDLSLHFTEDIAESNQWVNEEPLLTVSVNSADVANQTNTANDIGLSGYFSSFSFLYIFNNIIENSTEVLQLLWSDLKIIVLDNLHINSSPILQTSLILAIIFVLLVLVFLYRKQETEYLEITTPYTSPQPEIVPESSFKKNLSACINIQKKKLNEDYLVSGENVVAKVQPNDKFILADEHNAPLKKAKGKGKGKGMGILESAFEDNLSIDNFTAVDVAPENNNVLPNTEPDTQEPSNMLEAIEQLQFVHNETSDSKVNAFLLATQIDYFTDEMLENEFENIRKNEKVEVFIEEFELLINNLSNQKPALDRAPHELENVIQFKISIHMIKVLSEMMQALHLKQYSLTVIDFLDEVLNGKSTMTSEIMARLSIVIGFYNRYKSSIKGYHLV